MVGGRQLATLRVALLVGGWVWGMGLGTGFVVACRRAAAALRMNTYVILLTPYCPSS